MRGAETRVAVDAARRLQAKARAAASSISFQILVMATSFASRQPTATKRIEIAEGLSIKGTRLCEASDLTDENAPTNLRGLIQLSRSRLGRSDR